MEPVSPAVAGGFLTTAPPGKPQPELLMLQVGSLMSREVEPLAQGQSVSKCSCLYSALEITKYFYLKHLV